MPDSAKSKNYFPVEASIPDSKVSLESILCTEELRRRQSRLTDYNKENDALVALLGALLESHSNILQTLAETILDVTQCDSSGVSLLTKDDGGKRFYWPAIAGMWKPHIGGGTPRDFGPCGDALDRNCTLFFKHFERRYAYFLPITPLVEECLLAISRSIIAAHGVRLWAKANAPRGAVFQFTLPVRDRRTLRPKKRRHGSHRQ